MKKYVILALVAFTWSLKGMTEKIGVGDLLQGYREDRQRSEAIFNETYHMGNNRPASQNMPFSFPSSNRSNRQAPTTSLFDDYQPVESQGNYAQSSYPSVVLRPVGHYRNNDDNQDGHFSHQLRYDNPSRDSYNQSRYDQVSDQQDTNSFFSATYYNRNKRFSRQDGSKLTKKHYVVAGIALFVVAGGAVVGSKYLATEDITQTKHKIRPGF